MFGLDFELNLCRWCTASGFVDAAPGTFKVNSSMMHSSTVAGSLAADGLPMSFTSAFSGSSVTLATVSATAVHDTEVVKCALELGVRVTAAIVLSLASMTQLKVVVPHAIAGLLGGDESAVTAASEQSIDDGG